MQRRYTVLSLVVMGAVAWVLISPTKMQPIQPMKGVPKTLNSPQQILAEPSLSMMTVDLPPPPAASSAEPAAAPKTVVPMAVTKAVPLKENTVTPAKPTALVPVKKVVKINPLAPTSKPVPKPQVTTQQPVLQKTLVKTSPSVAEKKSGSDVKDQTKDAQRIAYSTAEANKKGRPLLKLLEFGKGPSIEIGWPDDSSTRDRLFRVFHHCYGMRIALMNDQGNLFDDSGRNGQPWAFNSDKFSGFVRQSQGHAGRSEAVKIQSIRHRHGLRSGNAVRLFPRETDALLLAGLRQLIGNDYSNNKTIQARYRISGWRVSVSDIYSNGTPIAGTVDLSGAVKTRCSI